MPSSAGQQITIVDARDDGLRLVPEFYRKVIAVSFPPDELESEEDLIAGLRSGRSRVLIARDCDGAIVGGAVGDYFPRSDVMLLAYLAVQAGGRGLGVGAAVLHAAKQAWMAELNPRLIVLEVEDPREFTGSEAFGDPAARVRFYERHGVRALPLPYMQPALSPGTARVPGLMLMVAGGAAVPAAGPAGGATIPGRHVAGFLTEYFEEFEGPARVGDAELGLLLAACDRPGGLRLMLARDLPSFAEMRGMAGSPLSRPWFSRRGRVPGVGGYGRTVNLALWIVQWALAGVFCLTALVRIADSVAVSRMPSIRTGEPLFTRGEAFGIGAVLLIGAFGLVSPIVPAAAPNAHWLVPAAAALLLLTLIELYQRWGYGDELSWLLGTLLLFVAIARLWHW